MTALPGTATRRASLLRRRGQKYQSITSAAILIAIVIFAVILVAPGLVAHTDPLFNGPDFLSPPSAQHIFGTDQLGRDMFSRVIFGTRPVLIASLSGVLLAALSGVAIGIIGGTAPRTVSFLAMRIVDVLLALPVLLIALILIVTIGPGTNSIVLALGVAYAPGFARVVEASVRKLRSIEYVQAAKLFGSSGIRTAFRHLLPNLMTEVIVMASSAIGWAVLTATTLSFLGLGVRLPNPDWGSDLAAGATNLSTAWWISTFPGIAIALTIFVANFLGDWVIGLIDPGARRRQIRFRPILGLRRSATSTASETGDDIADLTSSDISETRKLATTRRSIDPHKDNS